MIESFYLSPRFSRLLTEIRLGLTSYSSDGTIYLVDKFTDEFVVVINTYKNCPQIAAKEALETALLAYKVLRSKRFYFEAKIHLLQQLFSIVSKKLFRLQGSYTGVKVGMCALCISERNWWLGKAGDYRMYKYASPVFERMFPQTEDTDENICLGERQIIEPVCAQGSFSFDDTHLVTNNALALALNEKRIGQSMANFQLKSELKSITDGLINEAKVKRKQANYFALLIQKQIKS